MHFRGIHQDYFGFLFEHAKPLIFMPCSGKLGIFDIDLDNLFTTTPQAQNELF